METNKFFWLTSVQALCNVLLIFANIITLLMITRPTKLYMADSAITSPKSPVEPSGATRAPLERAPHSIDLDITLEDKDKVGFHCPLSSSESTKRTNLELGHPNLILG